jgi:predicted transglutaminase-like cysteine proteinase
MLYMGASQFPVLFQMPSGAKLEIMCSRDMPLRDIKHQVLVFLTKRCDFVVDNDVIRCWQREMAASWPIQHHSTRYAWFTFQHRK